MGLAAPSRLRERVPAGAGLLGALALAELLLIVGYFSATGARPTSLRYVVYPFVWINVGLWAAVRTHAPSAPSRLRRPAAGLAVGYFLLLAWLAGLIGVYPGGHASHSHAHVHGWQVALSAPGWGPRVGYAGDAFHAYFVPYRVLGYVSLAYLAYAAALEAGRAALSGVLGLVSCIGCAFPMTAALATAVVGPSSALVADVVGLSLDLSTAVFVLAVALLYWRPGAGGASP